MYSGVCANSLADNTTRSNPASAAIWHWQTDVQQLIFIHLPSSIFLYLLIEYNFVFTTDYTRCTEIVNSIFIFCESRQICGFLIESFKIYFFFFRSFSSYFYHFIYFSIM